jgi:N-acetylglucosamine-6-phosphate deacetylase
MIAIRAESAVTPQRTISPVIILIDRGKIAAVGTPDQVFIPGHASVMDVGDKIVAPGFIDTHTHGREGVYFGEEVATTAALCQRVASTGVTALLPTLANLLPMHYTLEMILERIATVRQVMAQSSGGAEVLGIHMEGPYLSSAGAVKGSQRAENMRPPSVEELRRMVEVSDGAIRKMGIAPELDGALEVIRELCRLGVVPCAAHSAASYDQTMAAVAAGLGCATHVFNGMLPFHHRQPGLVGAVLTCDRINAELIADGQHVSAPAMQVLLRCKGVDGIHLVTDNTIWAGMPNGTYRDGERTIVKEEDHAYVLGGTLIGSVAPMNRCVRNMMRLTGCSLAEVVQMASLNPARVIGLDDRKGSLDVGKDADLIVIDAEVNVHITIARGQVIFRVAD